MFFVKKVNRKEIIKWGIYSGWMESIFFIMAFLIFSKWPQIMEVSGGWEEAILFVLLLLFFVSFLTTSALIFYHPFLLLQHKRRDEAKLTVFIMSLTILLTSLTFGIFYFFF